MKSSEDCHNYRQAHGTRPGCTPQSPWLNGRGGTAHLWGTVENSSRREAAPSVLTRGRLCVLLLGHMAAMVPKGSQRRLLPNPMTHLLLSGAKQTPPPRWLPVWTHGCKGKTKSGGKKSRVAQRNVILSFASELRAFQAFRLLSHWQWDQLLQQQLERGAGSPLQLRLILCTQHRRVRHPCTFALLYNNW